MPCGLTQGTSDTAELEWPATLPAEHPGFPGRHVDEVDLGTFDQNDAGVGKEEPAADDRAFGKNAWVSCGSSDESNVEGPGTRERFASGPEGPSSHPRYVEVIHRPTPPDGFSSRTARVTMIAMPAI